MSVLGPGPGLAASETQWHMHHAGWHHRRVKYFRGANLAWARPGRRRSPARHTRAGQFGSQVHSVSSTATAAVLSPLRMAATPLRPRRRFTWRPFAQRLRSEGRAGSPQRASGRQGTLSIPWCVMCACMSRQSCSVRGWWPDSFASTYPLSSCRPRGHAPNSRPVPRANDTDLDDFAASCVFLACAGDGEHSDERCPSKPGQALLCPRASRLLVAAAPGDNTIKSD